MQGMDLKQPLEMKGQDDMNEGGSPTNGRDCTAGLINVGLSSSSNAQQRYKCGHQYFL